MQRCSRGVPVPTPLFSSVSASLEMTDIVARPSPRSVLCRHLYSVLIGNAVSFFIPSRIQVFLGETRLFFRRPRRLREKVRVFTRSVGDRPSWRPRYDRLNLHRHFVPSLCPRSAGRHVVVFFHRFMACTSTKRPPVHTSSRYAWRAHWDRFLYAACANSAVAARCCHRTSSTSP